jgi:radical SAM protein with 4Fe4S-binding SPASM domain
VGGDSIPELTFDQFLAERRLLERGVPVAGTLEITARCNLRCGHCYISRPAGDRTEAARELTFPELAAVTDEIADAGCLHLLVTGGEPLLRPDFPEIYRHVVLSGLRVTLFTNGTLLTEGIVDLLDAARPVAVEVTLYGATRETVEHVTGVPGSHESALEGIRLLCARGIPLRLKTMALDGNHGEVAAMREFARARGLPFRHDALVTARVSPGGRDPRCHQLAPARVVELDLEDPERTEALRRIVAGVVSASGRSSDRPLLDCGAGRTTFTIDSRGRLHPCGLVRRGGTDVRAGGFASAWQGLLAGYLSCERGSASPCRDCGIAGLCGSCAGAADLEHGDPEAPVAVFCRIAHLREHALGTHRPGHRADASCCLGPGC